MYSCLVRHAFSVIVPAGFFLCKVWTCTSPVCPAMRGTAPQGGLRPLRLRRVIGVFEVAVGGIRVTYGGIAIGKDSH